MAKYQSIVDSSWAEKALYAESIPHLLHWDLAYLWVLEKVLAYNEQQIPDDWQRRVEAWRHLVGLFLVGDVRVEEETITLPLQEFTKPYGIESVQWLVARLDGGDERIGVMSPTVLVRPLPDFSPEDRARWPADPHEGEDTRHFVWKIDQALAGGRSTFGRRLATVLQNQFSPKPLRPPAEGRPVDVPILLDLQWTQDAADGRSFDSAELYVSVESDGVLRYIPRCSEPNCDGMLLIENGTAVDVDGDADTVFVPCPTCGSRNPVALSDFLVWNRPTTPGRREAVVWQPSGQVGQPSRGLPPMPRIEGDVVRFVWNVAQANDKEHRELAFRFPGRTIRGPVSVSEVFYDKLLVPGEAATFSGMPVRAEWRDALVPTASTLAADDETGPRVDGEGPAIRVTYEGLRLAGWPDPIKWVYSGEKRIRHAPSLHLGVFPDPARMPANWKWYRTFVTDDGTDDRTRIASGEATLHADGGRLFPWLVESTDGPPQSLALTHRQAGVSYAPAWSLPEERPGERAHIVGLDFGTTNTLAYALSEEQRLQSPDPGAHGLQPNTFAGPTAWLSGSLPPTPLIAGFLPGEDYQGSATDPYVTPTALWTTDDASVIRWSPTRPLDAAVPSTNFKLDRDGSVHTRNREDFLKEYLFVMLPTVLASTAPVASPTVSLGMSFPLALNRSERKAFAALTRRTCDAVEERTGIRFERVAINEARACVTAFGNQNPGESFLIADMGGGTLDFALYTTQRAGEPDYHQIGSVEFAGEAFVTAVDSHMNGSAWDLRDAIRADRSRERYGSNQSILRLQDQFYTCAFEFIRTMIQAFRVEAPAQKLRVVLVGNGWHLVEAFDRAVDDVGHRHVFEDHYRSFRDDLGIDDVVLAGIDESTSILESLPSTKHLVVQGALRNAASYSAADELAESRRPSVDTLSKLPAGRRMDLNPGGPNAKTIAWHDLVGPGQKLEGIHPGDFDHIDVDFESAPPAADSWTARLRRTFDVEHPGAMAAPNPDEVRRVLQESRQSSSSKTALRMGPLQFALEHHWLKLLRRP